MPKKYTDTLAPRQQRFAEEYLIDLNGTKAAIRAGYSPRTAGSTANLLLKNARVRAVIVQGQNDRSERTGIDQDWVLWLLRDTAERCKKDSQYQPMAVLRAAELAGRHLGMFTDKLEVDGGLDGLGDRMTKALQRVQDAERQEDEDQPAEESIQ